VANTYSIHLVSKVPPQSLDPADIAAAVFQTVRECTAALEAVREIQDAIVTQMAAQLNALELTALRSIAPKVGRS
jgi:hypothetical protein